jgi:hypothetical protein
MRLQDTAALIEWIWLVPGLIASPVAVYLLVQVWEDYRYQRRQQNNLPERIWSKGQVYQKLIRVAILLCLLPIGIVAIITPPRPGPPQPLSPIAIALTASLVLVPTLVMLDSLQALLARRRARAAAARRIWTGQERRRGVSLAQNLEDDR